MMDLHSAYQPEHWHEAFVMLGGASAALAGLLMVAVSVRADQLSHLPHWWMRALNNTLSMISLTAASLMILSPQPLALLGAELIALNVLCALMLPGRVVLSQLRQPSDARTGVRSWRSSCTL